MENQGRTSKCCKIAVTVADIKILCISTYTVMGYNQYECTGKNTNLIDPNYYHRPQAYPKL